MKLANKVKGIIPSSKCFTSLWISVCILFLSTHVNLGMNEAKNVDLFLFPFFFGLGGGWGLRENWTVSVLDTKNTDLMCS